MNQNHNPTTLNSFRDQLEQGLDLMIHTEIGEVASCLEADEFMRWFFLPSDTTMVTEKITRPSIVQPEKYLGVILEETLKKRKQSEENRTEPFVCPIPQSRRSLKQPKRFTSEVSSNLNRVSSEREVAFNETVEKAFSLTQEMSVAELFLEIPSKIMKLVVQASKEWSMIKPGDRLLLGLSGPVAYPNSNSKESTVSIRISLLHS